MLTRLRNSFAFRSGSLYKLLLSCMPVYKKKYKQEVPFTLLILTGSGHVLMLRECLFSFYKSNRELPKLKIVSDGTISKETLKNHLKWYSNTLDILDKEECINYHLNKNRTELVLFAQNNPMGIKMAAILQSAEQEPTFYCDTDVLWFKEISGLLTQSDITNAGFFIKMSEDYQPAYDENLLKKHFHHLVLKPHFCAGVLFIKGNILHAYNLDPVLADASKNSNHFTEQTIFAGINRSNENNYWSNEKIACFQSDLLSLKPTFLGKNWITRHYVGPVRHLFWRDAFFLRILK